MTAKKIITTYNKNLCQNKNTKSRGKTLTKTKMLSLILLSLSLAVNDNVNAALSFFPSDTVNNPQINEKTLRTQNRGQSEQYTATAYCLQGTTASGTTAREGIVAVDPQLIPLGTELSISGYGRAIAEDTGGAIRGRRLDVYFGDCDRAVQWGRKQVKVTIIN